jgi:outer membrane protein assembly factor BamE (lipoprotein component of BamABCDE complex)
MACTPQIRTHGYVPNEDALSGIAVGRDNRESVYEAIGSPTSSGVMRDDGWYYISSRVKYETYQAPEEIERQIVAISFDSNGVVSNVERLSLEDGRVIALNRRITDIPVKGPGFFNQLIGNLGNFNIGEAI